MESMFPASPISEALVRYLEDRYPDRAITSLGITDREVWFRAGQVSVVRGIKADLERLRAQDNPGGTL